PDGLRPARAGRRRPRAGLFARRCGAVLHRDQLRCLARQPDVFAGPRRTDGRLRCRHSVLPVVAGRHAVLFGGAVRWLQPAALATAGAPHPDGLSVGNRLSKIYTRTGDGGSTGLGDGSRVGKDSLRVTAYGTVDEANSTIGLILASEVADDVRVLLTAVQHQLFDLGGELCIPGHAAISDEDVTRLEQHLDRFNADLPVLREFILPGGGEAAARCHIARTVVRRAERETVALSRVEPVRPEAVRYLNRLSDLLFVLARVLARASGHGEVLWNHERRKG